MEQNFFKFSAKTLQGKEINMNIYNGKLILVVNTASKCGLTPQYEGLEKLYQKYKDKGLIVLGFPCNQFGNQEPGNEKSISENCLINYGVNFPIFSKVDVNGNGAHLLFKYLKKELPGIFGKRVWWNFTKFLIDPNGTPLTRFSPFTTPKKIEKHIVSLLKT